MKKLVLSLTVVALLSLLAFGKTAEPSPGLPSLHVIKTAVLSPAYSCRSAEQFKEGYRSTALFLSDYSRGRNSPDLLFNGACGSTDYFEAATSGDDMSLIADLGSNSSIEDLSASQVFNLQRVHSFSAYSNFARVAKVELNHTYAVLLNNADKRGLFVFTVTEHAPNKQVGLQYAVKSYQVWRDGQVESSSGFAWEKKSDR